MDLVGDDHLYNLSKFVSENMEELEEEFRNKFYPFPGQNSLTSNPVFFDFLLFFLFYFLFFLISFFISSFLHFFSSSSNW